MIPAGSLQLDCSTSRYRSAENLKIERSFAYLSSVSANFRSKLAFPREPGTNFSNPNTPSPNLHLPRGSTARIHHIPRQIPESVVDSCRIRRRKVQKSTTNFRIKNFVVDFCTKEGADPRAGGGQRLNAFRRFTLGCFRLHQQCVRG